jgi:hypothetical protein
MSTLSVDTIQPYSGTTVTIVGFTVSGSAVTGSVASASYAATSSYATNFNVAGTLSAASASITYLTTVYETSSVIYSSGSNQFGDASNDVQTFYGAAEFKTGPVRLTGSAAGNLVDLNIISNTASLDCLASNLFTLQLVSGSNTFINPTNIQGGQTFNVLISTTGSATVSFPTTVKQVSGSAYVPTTTTATDVLSFIAKDSSTLLLASIKNLV